MKYTTIIIFILLCSVNAWAELPPPPVMANQPVELNQYLKRLYDNRNTIPVITSSPNGVRNGASGDVVIVNTNNVFKLWVNQGGTVWTQI